MMVHGVGATGVSLGCAGFKGAKLTGSDLQRSRLKCRSSEGYFLGGGEHNGAQIILVAE